MNIARNAALARCCKVVWFVTVSPCAVNFSIVLPVDGIACIIQIARLSIQGKLRQKL